MNTNFFEQLDNYLRNLIREELHSKVLSTQHETADEGNESRWIKIEEAKKIVPIVSKRKWQELRDRGEIVFCKPGKNILYETKSLYDFLQRQSNLKRTIKNNTKWQ